MLLPYIDMLSMVHTMFYITTVAYSLSYWVVSGGNVPIFLDLFLVVLVIFDNYCSIFLSHHVLLVLSIR